MATKPFFYVGSLGCGVLSAAAFLFGFDTQEAAIAATAMQLIAHINRFIFLSSCIN